MNIRCVGPLLYLALLLPALSLPARGIDLAESVRLSVERHPRFPLHRALSKVGEGYRRQADSLLGGDPSANLSVAGDPLGTDFGYREYTLGASLPLWLPGQRDARRRIADGLENQAGMELLNLTWEVSGEVLDRAWRVRIARARVRQALKQWASARALEKDVTHRFNAGELTRIDMLLARQDVIASEVVHQEAVSDRQRARLAWFNYTGQQALPEDLDSFVTAANPPELARHPRLLAALAKAGIARAKAGDTRLRRRAPPVISIYAKRDRGARSEAYTDSLGIELSLPFGSRAQAAPAIAEAEAESTGAESEAALVKRQLELRIASAEEAVLKAERLLVLARRKHQASRARLKLSQRAFELGEMDLYQLLLARQQAALAARDLEIRQLEKQHAMAQKTHSTGVIPQ